MATIINNRFFKTPQGKKRYLLPPFIHKGGLKRRGFILRFKFFMKNGNSAAAIMDY